MNDRKPFWSDDFDMDLLKVFANAEELIGATADVKLRTLGHERNGSLIHPSVWNSHGAFLWLGAPYPARDANGWVHYQGHVTDSPEVECTWLEWLRDNWVHGYSWILQPSGEYFQSRWCECFDSIMYHRRGWQDQPDIESQMDYAWIWLLTVNMRFAHIVERHRLKAGERFCYFKPGSVPGVNAAVPTWSVT